MPREFDIKSSTIPLFAEYFYALTLNEDKDIFNTNVSSHMLKVDARYNEYDVVEKIITPLKNNGTLKDDGGKLLVPLEGYLTLPDAAPAAGKYPLVIILHGNHPGYVEIDGTQHKPSGANLGTYVITPFGVQIMSYTGYKKLQHTLANCGIASYSINLNIVNSLDNAEPNSFEIIAVDVNQRILVFFLHLKLLKIIAGDSLTGDNFPIRFLDGATFKNLKTVLPSTTNTELIRVRTAIQGLLDFTRLGLMGHSRGADAVSRIHAYCFIGTTPATVTFAKHIEVDKRIKDLAQQTRPQQDHIKSILALQPVAAKKVNASDTEGYKIDNKQTLFFVAVGTHDEDVSFDPVRLYEHPTCPKVMISINGASHKRFNTVWAVTPDPKDLKEVVVKVHLLNLGGHLDIMENVFAKCFTVTLGNTPADLLFFTKENTFPVKLPKANHIQCAWQFGLPFGNTPAEMKDLKDFVSGIDTDDLDDTGKPFEQEISAFVEERENEGTFSFNIAINPADAAQNLSKYTHFSFRFAKGVKITDKNAEDVEKKNFAIEFFENSTLQGKAIEGKDITTIELKAVRAFDENGDAEGNNPFVYSILLQTVEVPLTGRTGTDKTTKIQIRIFTDTSKAAPRSGKVVIGGSILLGVVGSALGLLGGHIYNKEKEIPEEDRYKALLVGGLGLGGLFWLVSFLLLRSDKDAFAFKNFLLTNRVFP